MGRQKKPNIVITMGDPAGIGPEILVKSLAEAELYQWCHPIVVGDWERMKQAAKICNVEQILQTPAFTFCAIAAGHPITAGQISPQAGKAAYAFIEKATELCLCKEAQAMVTAPIQKEALYLGGVPYIGHTEILAGLTDTADPLTMFYVRGMRIFFLTRHIPFSDICTYCTEERIYDYIKRCTQYLSPQTLKKHPFAVAALNPHGGDHGLFGQEETQAILPAIQRASRDGISVTGPVPADSVFHLALQGKFSGVLSLYHDQGHIAAKTLDFERTVAVTHGLPFLRTSVDHGTALDIAGTGTASPVSLLEAIRAAAEMLSEQQA